MNADVKDIVLRKEAFVSTCCSQYKYDVEGKAYRISLQKSWEECHSFSGGRIDHGHLKSSGNFTKLCCSRIGPEVTCFSSSCEACNSEQSALFYYGSLFQKLKHNETHPYIFHLHLR